MKKIVIITLLGALLMSLTGCGNKIENMSNEERLTRMACRNDNKEYVSFDGIDETGRLMYTVRDEEYDVVSHYIIPMETVEYLAYHG